MTLTPTLILDLLVLVLLTRPPPLRSGYLSERGFLSTGRPWSSLQVSHPLTPRCRLSHLGLVGFWLSSWTKRFSSPLQVCMQSLRFASFLIPLQFPFRRSSEMHSRLLRFRNSSSTKCLPHVPGKHSIITTCLASDHFSIIFPVTGPKCRTSCGLLFLFLPDSRYPIIHVWLSARFKLRSSQYIIVFDSYFPRHASLTLLATPLFNCSDNAERYSLQCPYSIIFRSGPHRRSLDLGRLAIHNRNKTRIIPS
jgi:hypothetical protein